MLYLQIKVRLFDLAMSFFSLKTLFVLAATAVFSACSSNWGEQGEVVALKCEYAVSPINVDTQSPRFTWCYSEGSSFVQGGYRIAVATSQEKLSSPDVWDSGSVTSSLPFAKMEDTGVLRSVSDYYWQVTVWNADSSETIVSAPGHFKTAFTRREDWKAKWITDSMDRDTESAPMFRKEFDAGKDIVSASLYSSACAYGVIRLNGELTSDNFLDPGYTDYSKRNLYTVTDVTDKVKAGKNVVTVVLGNGFYNEIKPVATWDFEKAAWRNRARFIMELRITHEDGSVTVIPTDGTWKTTSDGPYVSNNIYSGDTYDARKEIKGWEKAGFDDSSLASAKVVSAPAPLLVAQKMPRIRATEKLSPVAVRSFGDTVHVFDFGINISGLCELNVYGSEGTELTLAHAELLKDNGRIEPGNIDIYYNSMPGYDFQTDKYIMKGGGTENWTPSFTYHGFRYVEVRSSEPVKMDESSLTALHFHTALESVGSFDCSNDLLDSLWRMTRRTYLNNLMSIPTDCPQREKNGWTADGYLSQELGMLNYDGILFYEKWLDDFVDNQLEDGRISGIIPTSGWGYDDWIGPVWDAALFIIPYNLYLYYGDKSVIEKVWPVCVKYLSYLRTREDKDGLVSYGIGDWLSYEANTPTEYTSALLYYYDCKLMKEFSFLLNEESSTWIAKEGALRDAVNKKYYDPRTGMYASGTQAGQAAALYFGVVPASETRKVADGLAKLVNKEDNHLNFGSMGAKCVLRALTNYGYADLAYEMASKEDHPSWLAWIHDGYTTLAETWILSPQFRDASLDHVFFGDISAWLVNDIVGIKPDIEAPGFSHFFITPHFVKGLDHAKASYDSVKGKIEVGWTRKRDKIVLETTIPSNTTASLRVGGSFGQMELRPGRHVIDIDI